jgi:hypothetical protein
MKQQRIFEQLQHPAVLLDGVVHQFRQPPHERVDRLLPERSEKLVKPTISAKRTVTSLRSASTRVLQVMEIWQRKALNYAVIEIGVHVPDR